MEMITNIIVLVFLLYCLYSGTTGILRIVKNFILRIVGLKNATKSIDSNNNSNVDRNTDTGTSGQA